MSQGGSNVSGKLREVLSTGYIRSSLLEESHKEEYGKVKKRKAVGKGKELRQTDSINVMS